MGYYSGQTERQFRLVLVSVSVVSVLKQHSSVLGAVMINCSVSLPDGNLCFQ